VFRRLLPRIAAGVGVSEDDWPYLTVGELDGSIPSGELTARAGRRREECARALREEAPELLAPGGASLPVRDRPQVGARARGVSPGTAAGVVVRPDHPELNGHSGGRILVCD